MADTCFELLDTQQGLWTAQQIAKQSQNYLIAHAIDIHGPIDAPAMVAAIASALREADTLNAVFEERDGKVCQVVPDLGEVAPVHDIEVVDLTGMPDAHGEAERRMRADLERGHAPFAPLHRLFQLDKTGAGIQWIWYQRYHHIMLDGFSLNVLTDRILACYEAGLAQAEPAASPFEPVAAAVAEQRAYVASRDWQDDRTYWQDVCADLPQVPDLLTAAERSSGNPVAGPDCEYDARLFGGDALRRLEDLSRLRKLTVVDVATAAVAMCLSRLTGQCDLVLGMPMMRRLGFAALSSSAPVVNVLPLRLRPDLRQTLWDLATQVKTELAGMRRAQRFPSEQIRRDLGLAGSARALWAATLNLRLYETAPRIAGHAARLRRLAIGPLEEPEFGLRIDSTGLHLDLRVPAGRHSVEDLSRLWAQVQTLLRQGVEDPDRKLADFTLLEPEEAERLQAWQTGPYVASDIQAETLADLFFEGPLGTGAAPALRHADTVLSGAQVVAQSGQLARLLAERGVGQGECVVVALPRSHLSVLAIFAIFACGATYVPLDLACPDARLAAICRQVRPRLILTTQAAQSRLDGVGARLCLDDADVQATMAREPHGPLRPVVDPVDHAAADGIAYVIFTSGSTGTPKGVMVSHRALMNLFNVHRAGLMGTELRRHLNSGQTRPLRAAHSHSFAFDAAWDQLFWMLLGQELVVLGEEERHDPQGFLATVRAQALDILDVPPSFCVQLLEAGLFDSGAPAPCVLLLGGEAIPPSLWQRLVEEPGVAAYNAYGPTEFTVDACVARLARRETPGIGRPVGNTRAFVLDHSLSLQPVGIAGELYLAGPGIASGYLGQPALTATRFVPNPFAAGETLYRTGDRARWRADGSLDMLGRADTQVQVRGNRVEPAEVATALTALEGVQDAFVLAEPMRGSHRLIGYCVGNLDTAAIAMLRTQLADRLPGYMVPAAIVALARLPMTVNGKIDVDALPKPQWTQGRAAQTEQEKRLCILVAEVLETDAVDLEQDFFASGGDSISAMVLCNALRKSGWALKMRDVFETPVLQDLAATLKPIATDAQPAPVRARAVPDRLPLLAAQKGILFHAQLGDAAGTYNATTRLVLTGALDVNRLRAALDGVLQRHPQLTGYFATDEGGTPCFRIPAQTGFQWPWAYHDLMAESEADRPRHQCRIETAAAGNLRLTETPMCLLGADLIRLTPDRHVLILNLHHAIIDGWSTPVLLNEILAAYRDGPACLPPLDHDYASVLQALDRRDTSMSETFWRDYVQGVTPTCLFHNGSSTANVAERRLALTAEQSDRLRGWARAGGVTLNVVMQALWANVLSAFSGRQDVVFGTAVAGRSAPVEGIGEQIGMFLNVIPVRVDLDPGRALRDQLPGLQQRHAEAMEHDMLDLATIQGFAGGQTLFDTLLVVENYPDSSYLDQDLDGLRVTDIHNRGYSHYPLALLVLPGVQIRLVVECRGDADLAARVGAVLEQMLHALLEDDRITAAQLPLLPVSDAALLETVNDTAHPLPDLTLRDLIVAQAGRSPDAVALEDGDHRLTFRQTRHQVLHLADRLRRAGALKGQIIAVGLPRSVRMSIAILAVIEIGAVYLPLDPGYPRERLEFLQQDATPALVITETGIDPGTSDATRILFDGLAGPGQPVRDLVNAPDLTGRDPAYLLYTSGTTGRPKGALVSHAAIVNRILWMQAEYPLDESDAILQKTPCGFDVSLWEFFWSHLVGARLVMAPPDTHRDPQAILRLIRQHRITTLHFVPSVLSLFNDAMAAAPAPACPGLRRVFCSGEALTGQAVADFARHCAAELHNLYGPTEAAIDVTRCPALPYGKTEGGVPIGKPVWNTGLRILDHLLRPVPMGVSGELYLTGVQLADGYLGRAALTSERFVADPLVSGSRMYRTGDLACWGAAGDVTYLGRSDHQIKIRGQRVEPHEIANSLMRQPEITDAVVLATPLRADGEPCLVAYVVPEALPFDTGAALEALAAQLPAFMVPQHCLVLDALPINANGKLDRQALPRPDPGQGAKGRAPAPGVETDLARIFCDLLGLEEVSATDDFFAIGGHSLLAMRLAARIRQDLKRHIQVGQIVSMATVERLAEHFAAGAMVGALVADGFDPVIRLREGPGVPLICIYPASGVSWQYGVLARYLKNDMPIIGLQSPRPNGPIAASADLEALCDAQYTLIRDLQPRGPYYLLGYSLGGNIAFGLAERLEAAGEEVRFLGLLDTYPAEHHDWSDPDGGEAEAGAEREQEQLLNDAMGDMMDAEFQKEKAEMFGHIFDNYRDAVRLLSSARTGRFSGRITLFVADKSDLPDIDPDTSWLGHVGAQDVHHLPNASHEDIVSPASLEVLGPLLNLLISEAGAGCPETSDPDTDAPDTADAVGVA